MPTLAGFGEMWDILVCLCVHFCFCLRYRPWISCPEQCVCSKYSGCSDSMNFSALFWSFSSFFFSFLLLVVVVWWMVSKRMQACHMFVILGRVGIITKLLVRRNLKLTCRIIIFFTYAADLVKLFFRVVKCTGCPIFFFLTIPSV